MKRAALAAAILVAGIGFYAVAGGRVYRGPAEEPRGWSGDVERARVADEARKLVGVWHDPLEGSLGNVGGRLGLIVSMDVPLIAYRNAGASIQRLLEADYAAHPDRYGPRGTPGDPLFHRRPDNLYTYCRNNDRLASDGTPRPGDVVFLSWAPHGPISHVALVSQVRSDGKYWVVEASRDFPYAAREVDAVDLIRRGWLFRGFGRVLGR